MKRTKQIMNQERIDKCVSEFNNKPKNEGISRLIERIGETPGGFYRALELAGLHKKYSSRRPPIFSKKRTRRVKAADDVVNKTDVKQENETMIETLAREFIEAKQRYVMAKTALYNYITRLDQI